MNPLMLLLLMGGRGGLSKILPLMLLGGQSGGLSGLLTSKALLGSMMPGGALMKVMVGGTGALLLGSLGIGGNKTYRRRKRYYRPYRRNYRQYRRY